MTADSGEPPMRDLLPPSEEPVYDLVLPSEEPTYDLLPPSEDDEGTLVELPDDRPTLFGVDQTLPRFVLVPLEPNDLLGLFHTDDPVDPEEPGDFGVCGEKVLPVNAWAPAELDRFGE